MIESIMTFDLMPGIDMKAYQEWVSKVVDSLKNQPGMLEFRANRNMLGNPMSRTVTVWKSLEDWAIFSEGPWQQINMEFRRFATNFNVEIWGPSPIVKDAIRKS
ncbi:hypothetical protein AcdelDRAFT_1173 [Acidovorax delafieldii 2AN]|uniref:ABM domain-containing protein n=1 Tax=Acidovorax delafieldii 2AN TaxID=573060 RepID=C5T2P3_ACIDE|nr:hypothetical protein [Acidovorax delafieldii]EER61226.1 hypothetical protein AcdelDRAFT_1173 [Acidovorax delafieldii 2AN]